MLLCSLLMCWRLLLLCVSDVCCLCLSVAGVLLIVVGLVVVVCCLLLSCADCP